MRRPRELPRVQPFSGGTVGEFENQSEEGPPEIREREVAGMTRSVQASSQTVEPASADEKEESEKGLQ